MWAESFCEARSAGGCDGRVRLELAIQVLPHPTGTPGRDGETWWKCCTAGLYIVLRTTDGRLKSFCPMHNNYGNSPYNIIAT